MANKLMKISYAIITFLILVLFISEASAVEFLVPSPLEVQLSSDGKTLYNAIPAVVVIADPNPHAQQVRVPARFDLLTLSEKVTATFSITYVADGGTDPWGASCTTFPEEAKAAFHAAAATWGNLLQSSVPITISACWSNLGSSRTLGYSGGGPLRRNFTGAPLTNTWYAGSLANALAGSDLDPSSFDMHITYNSEFSWYYGTDGVTPSGQYDLMSVVLHEIAHGLNFSGSMSYSGGTGSWGFGTGYPVIYDTFMRDGTANSGSNLLIDTGAYANPSVALGSALTFNNIWFHGTITTAANGGQKVKMYAPSPWSSGSSYSHLDYSTFKDTANSLMVYSLPRGVARHDPGPVTLGIFEDMGWPIVTIEMVDSPDPATVGNNLTYTITVTASQYSPVTATSVNVTDSLPAGVSYVSATPSQGICNGTNNVTCDLGTINNGNSATVKLVVTPTVTGTLNNTASVTSVPSPTTGSATASTTVDNPVPVISSLNPSSAIKGGVLFTLTVNGSNFVSSSQVKWNGANRTTTFVSATQLTAAILAADILTESTANVTVVNPTPGGGISNTSAFTISTPQPSGGGGVGCFIATAAFGSPLEKRVQILRDFRDRILLNSSAGKEFVQFYYRTSPAIADKIVQSEGLRFITRVMLMPVIGVAYLILQWGMLRTILLLTIIVLTVIFTIEILRKKIGKSARAKAAA